MYPPEPIRLSYSVVACDPPRGSSAGQLLRVLISYASGKEHFLRANFRTQADADAFIERFHPDLVGKCTSADRLPPPKTAEG